MKKNAAIAMVMLLLGACGAFLYLHFIRAPGASGSAEGEWCAEHQIAEAQCPWCDPSLVEKMGSCPEHGVPEALCVKCNTALIPGFKAEQDWCAGHGVPESQCALCRSGQLPSDERK